MRIAKPLLTVTTALGAAIGLREACRFHWWLALLMAALFAVLGALLLMTFRRIRSEARRDGSG